MISAAEFRNVLSNFASGVTVITTCDGDARPQGLTASAFTSVSLDPPLVLVCVDHKAQSFPALRESDRFAVNILAIDQQEVSRRFATTGFNKFDSLPFSLSPLGLPLIEGAIAHIECVTVNQHLAGDHTIFVGQIERATIGTGEPLLYFRGRYSRLAGDTT